MYNVIINYLHKGLLYLVTLLVAWMGSSLFQDGNESLADKNPDQVSSEVELVISDEEKKVDVYIDGEIFTSYIYPDHLKKPVLYPINSSKGTAVTRGFPINPRPGERTDHPHHVGMWLNYGDVEGLDFWNNSNEIPPEKKQSYGSIYHTSINDISSGEGQGELDVTMEWRGPEGEMLLKENTIFIFRGMANKRMIDRITRLTAPDKDISMTDNKEGMLGLRMRRELEHPDEHFEATGIYKSSEGLEGNDVWGTRGKWVNLAGWVNDEQISVAILDHPENVGYPTYWHARGYGLFAANPLGQSALSDGKDELNFSLSAGQSVTFKHRVVIYSGEEITDERLNEEWEEFVQ